MAPLKVVQTGMLWTALVGAAVAGGIAATGGKRARPVGHEPPYASCASQPSDGGQCLMRRPDGGVVKFGPGTQFNAKHAFGECEVKPCAKLP